MERPESKEVEIPERVPSTDSSIEGMDLRPENPVPKNFPQTPNADDIQNLSINKLLPTTNVPEKSLNEAIIAAFTDKFTATLANIADRFAENTTARTSQLPICTFSGLDLEDPELFLRQVNNYFRKSNITEDTEKLYVVEDLLRGEARKWFEAYKDGRDTYVNFENRFILYFNSQTRLSAITVALYGERQRDNEPVNIFVTKKRNQCLRINLNLT